MLCPTRIGDHRGIRMNWIEAIGDIWLTALAWIVGLGLLFFVLTRFSPCNPGRSWWADRRAALTDLVYWLVLPLLTQLGRVAFLVAGRCCSTAAILRLSSPRGNCPCGVSASRSC